MPELMNEKRAFLNDHAAELRPQLDVNEKRQLDDLGSTNTVTQDRLLERFETKLYTFSKAEGEYDEGAKNVLMTVSDPGPSIALFPILQKLTQDRHCRSLSLLCDGVAGQAFEKNPDLSKSFHSVRTDGQPLLGDIKTVVEKFPPDVILNSFTTRGGPERLTLFSGKTILGSPKAKSYYIFEGWVPPDLSKKNIETLDGVFCNDELAKSLLLAKNPQLEAEHIYTTGTAQLDDIDYPHADEYHARGREKLEIPNDEFAFLFLANPQSDFPATAQTSEGEIRLVDNVPLRTWEKTLHALSQFAQTQPNKKFHCICRPHPRDANPTSYFEIAQQTSLPVNVRVVDGSRTRCTINEATYAADIIASFLSTETFKAQRRGKRGVFLFYDDEPGLGGDAAYAFFDPASLEAIQKNPTTNVVRTEAECALAIQRVLEEPPPDRPNAVGVDSSQKILDIIFG